MHSGRTSQVIKQRVLRHNRLMKMIKNYIRSEQQIKKLQRIKMNTMMQINIRYLRSDHNRYYKFPKKDIEESQDEQQSFYDPIIDKKENIVYDLRSQNQILPAKSLSQKVLSLDNSRKIASLEIQRNNAHRENILRLHTKSTKQLPGKLHSRKNSISDRYKKEGFRLPELKLEKGRQYLKTQTKNQQQQQLNSVIGKKLHTESSEQQYKLKGVQRYLKKIEHIQKQHETKNQYRKKIFLPDKGL